ncbi:MAG: hypothetical protein RR585_08885 [Coprobacillus sp.]
MLIRLIKSEIRKIFKIKMNVILFIVAILGTSAFVGLKYFEYGAYSSVQNQQGESIDGISLLRYVDNIRHQYVGEWTIKKAEQYKKDYKELIKKISESAQIDQDKMEFYYGSNYQYLLDKFNKNELKTKDYFEFVEKNEHEKLSMDFNFKGDRKSQELWELKIYYKDDEILNGISTAYIDGFGRSDREGGRRIYRTC